MRRTHNQFNENDMKEGEIELLIMFPYFLQTTGK